MDAVDKVGEDLEAQNLEALALELSADATALVSQEFGADDPPSNASEASEHDARMMHGDGEDAEPEPLFKSGFDYKPDMIFGWKPEGS